MKLLKFAILVLLVIVLAAALGVMGVRVLVNRDHVPFQVEKEQIQPHCTHNEVMEFAPYEEEPLKKVWFCENCWEYWGPGLEEFSEKYPDPNGVGRSDTGSGVDPHGSDPPVEQISPCPLSRWSGKDWVREKEVSR